MLRVCLQERNEAIVGLAAAARRLDKAAVGSEADFPQAHQALLTILDVEELKLGGSLTDLACRFGPANPLVQQILGGKSRYDENGHFIPPFTSFGDLYRKAAEHQNRPPFNLPKSWQDRQKRLDPQTKFNFVTTADTTGSSVFPRYLR
jgi:hypothetical protein